MLKKLWATYRASKILKSHRMTAAFWKPFISSYLSGDLPHYALKAKKDMDSDNVIWQYWGQGLDGDLPEIVRISFASVDRYKGDYKVIRLDDNNVRAYIDFPDFVWEKLQNPDFNKTFFSDLLRLALLASYGGVWLDATILMTGRLPSQLTNLPYFMFQRSDDAQHKSYWKSTYAYYWNWHPDFKVNVLNSIFMAKQGNGVVVALLDIMLQYWKTQQRIVDYFFFQVLYDELMRGPFGDQRCPVISDTLPHLIQTKINGHFDDMSYLQAMEYTVLHKMTYFSAAGLQKLESVLKQHTQEDRDSQTLRH